MKSTEAFVTVFRVLNPLKIGVCEEHAHSHSIVAITKTLVFIWVSEVVFTSV